METGDDDMGFSLEAMVAIPCCLTILAQTSGLVVPLSKQVKQTADITAFASLQTRSSGYTCRHKQERRNGLEVPTVETSPQRAVEAISLTRDLIATIRGHGTPVGGPVP